MKYLLLLAIVVLSGCAMTYTAPTTTYTAQSFEAQGKKSELFKTARKVLILEGYQLANGDEASGTISTSLKSLKVTPEQADCGTTMGIDYLKDKRTSTRVAYGLFIDDNTLTVKASIEGEYKPGTVPQDITLTCVSRGLLERDLFDKIKKASAAKN